MMEAFEGRRADIRRDISSRLDALEGLLTEELAKKLSERKWKSISNPL